MAHNWALLGINGEYIIFTDHPKNLNLPDLNLSNLPFKAVFWRPCDPLLVLFLESVLEIPSWPLILGALWLRHGPQMCADSKNLLPFSSFQLKGPRFPNHSVSGNQGHARHFVWHSLVVQCEFVPLCKAEGVELYFNVPRRPEGRTFSPLVFHLCPDESGHANLCQFLPALLNQICFPVTFSIKAKSHLRIAVLTYWRRFSMQHRGKSAKAQNEMSIKWLRDKSARIKSTKFRFLRADSHRAI